MGESGTALGRGSGGIGVEGVAPVIGEEADAFGVEAMKLTGGISVDTLSGVAVADLDGVAVVDLGGEETTDLGGEAIIGLGGGEAVDAVRAGTATTGVTD